MWSHDPETDLIGTVQDLVLPFPADVLLLDAAGRIGDRAIRACLTGVILASAPHRYATLPGHPDTPYDHSGGRVLRAGVMTRAVVLLTSSHACVRDDMIAAAFVGGLSPGSVEPASRPCVEQTLRWLINWSRYEADHLATWGCSADRVSGIATLATRAERSTHPIPRERAHGPDLIMAMACHAARLAGPVHRSRSERQLARWVDPQLSDIAARRLLLEAIRPLGDVNLFMEPAAP